MRTLLIAAIILRIASAAEPCVGAPATGEVRLPGSPFKIAVSSDGCRIYVSLAGPHQTGIAILERASRTGTIALASIFKTREDLTGLVLTRDGSTLIATNGRGVVLIDAAKARAGAKNAIIGTIEEDSRSLSVYADVSSDDRTLFVSNERSASITVIDLATPSIVGHIPTGNAPIALAFSPDGRWLYTTSQGALAEWGWPAVCEAESPQGASRSGKHAQGAVLVIDAALARKDPAHAVVSRIEAGCNPVRLALSPSGDRIYVTARKDDALIELDSAQRVRITAIPVGPAPVPVAVVNGGATILVGNSNRFGNGKAPPSTLSVIDAATARVVATIPAGSFPRDIVTSPDQRTVYVANFGSQTIGVLDPAQLPVQATGRN